MELFEDKIYEYINHCQLDFRGLLDKRCKLSGTEMLEIEDLAQLSHVYTKNLLSKKLREDFENRLNQLKTKLSKEKLLELLLKL